MTKLGTVLNSFDESKTNYIKDIRKYLPSNVKSLNFNSTLYDEISDSERKVYLNKFKISDAVKVVKAALNDIEENKYYYVCAGPDMMLEEEYGDIMKKYDIIPEMVSCKSTSKENLLKFIEEYFKALDKRANYPGYYLVLLTSEDPDELLYLGSES